MTQRASRLLILLLLSTSLCAFSEDSGLEYRVEEYSGGSYRVVMVDPKTVDLQLFWKDEGGKPLGTFKILAESLGEQDLVLRFAMNAGIYAKDRTPLGLHVEEGETLEPLNLKTGGGNFFLKPNGVFYVMPDGQAAVCKSETYAARNVEPRIAVQSGPLLLEEGELHPRFLKDSTSFHFRNGVGILPDGRIAFVLSQWPVNFYRFALFFKETLGCKDALYLDGSLSGIYFPEEKLNQQVEKYVGMLGVVAAREEKP